MKRMTKESAVEMEGLYSTITQIYRTLETLGRPVNTWDDFLVFITVQRLDSESVKAWELHLGSTKDPPTWKQFIEFLMSRLLTLQAVEKSRKPGSQHNPRVTTVHHASGDPSNFKKCSICSADHYTAKCPEFANKPLEKKLAIIKDKKLCYNCLRNHLVNKCTSTRRCMNCGKRHHTAIHRDEADSTPNVQANLTSYSTSTANQTLLATAQVAVVSEQGYQVQARALIDPGSQVSFISKRLVQQLHLKRKPVIFELHGIGAVNAGRTQGLVSVTLRPHFKSSQQVNIQAHVLPKLTARIQATSSANWSHFQQLQLADPSYNQPGKIDVIIGADYYGQICLEGLRKGPNNSPTAQSTIFGWILFGPTGNSSTSSIQCFHTSVDEELYELIQRFWKLDDIPVSNKSSLTPNDQECEDHFKETHSRDNTGRYIVRLPFKKPVESLGESKSAAHRMLFTLSKRFLKDSSLRIAYHGFMDEYQRLQHMRLVSKSTAEPKHSYYLPHHGVIREQSLTTKLRVVFNASCKTSSGLSLNDILHTGPKLQTELIDVLLRFRFFKYVFVSDIEKMYRQIMVHPNDWDLQRILWKNEKDELIIYQLMTVTYGMACAPFLALRVMQQLVEDEGPKYPLAISTLTKGRYVDDVFGGEDSIQEAQETVKQVNNLCMAGGFPLKKWISNEPSTLQSISSADQLLASSVTIDKSTVVHALGMNWSPITDKFQFTWNIPAYSKITKRTILSTIARFFDPLGLLAPVVITAKIFIQQLWTNQLDWDDPLSAVLSNQWKDLIQSFQEMNQMSIPRWLQTSRSNPCEIHGFCDASQQALAAVIYVLSKDPNEKTQTVLLCSKTKVAPIKRLTIPRLELSAAVLLTKLVHHVLQKFEIKKPQVHLWTDSAITHTWINNHPSRWKEFIHNRVCFIQETLPAAKWHFVPGKENPADCATRGLTPTQLFKHSIWWFGPEWLKQSSSSWPNGSTIPTINDHLEERPIKVMTTKLIPMSIEEFLRRTTPKPFDQLNRIYHNLTRLLRITALCRRFILRLRKKAANLKTEPITVQELNDAKFYWVKITQQHAFNQEIKQLSRGEHLSNSNPLVRLTPFIDSQGILRVGGRLESSHLPFGAKHPAILPRNSPLTKMIIDKAHQKTLHGGIQKTLSFILDEFWIIGGRTSVKSAIWNCVRCARFRQIKSQQLMGQLPIHRVTPSRPFLHTGVDYAGPFMLKTWRGRNAREYKAYIALFVCESTSAIHLELVTDYTTNAFIAAYKRFTARRGICATLRSDCGTNLRGADSELRNLFSSTSKQLGKLASLLANDGTQWLFNPPSAPHFGGKWESGVRSTKHHLCRVIGEQQLTYEEMSTFLTQVEAVLNSRPLCSLTEDPDDLSVLTPGHFLIGGPLNIVPEPSLEDIQISRLSRWQLLRRMTDDFWTKWSKEYLQKYQPIYKWNQPMPEIKPGSLVLITDERYPPTKWPLGRIIKVHPGKDGHVRVVTVKTATSTFERPVTKLRILPIH
ncbi:uncharacterized protein LOC123272233 [Cotesia glomerata]|uniref:uncharacterized protein LOC123272233 n=1 Tax=Cotesia glomerata TaxID=32391 RepID=UPI001D03030E|nr:uncharacterized protein LOC123272233 [Cotesia glomerata]